MSVPFAQAYAGRSVLITGHTGFKGSWLALWLHHLGARVTGYALAPLTSTNHFEAARIRELLAAHHEADIRDRRRLAGALADAQPDVIFHLAAQALVRESYRSPLETFDVNVMGTACLLDALRAAPRPCAVVIVTSDKCYENREPEAGCRESDPMGGFDPYSASKGAAEIVTAAYRRSFFPPDRLAGHGVRLASARAGNVIGGGDWARDRIVADAVRALSENRGVPVRNPGSVRPWQHVLEPLGGYLTLAARLLTSPAPELCSAWNFGPAGEGEATVRQLVERLLKAWGGGSWDDLSAPEQPHEATTLRLRIDKAVEQLGWRPRWDLETAVARTARWYRRFYGQPGPMREASVDDITAFEAAG